MVFGALCKADEQYTSCQFQISIEGLDYVVDFLHCLLNESKYWWQVLCFKQIMVKTSKKKRRPNSVVEQLHWVSFCIYRLWFLPVLVLSLCCALYRTSCMVHVASMTYIWYYNILVNGRFIVQFVNYMEWSLECRHKCPSFMLAITYNKYTLFMHSCE